MIQIHEENGLCSWGLNFHPCNEIGSDFLEALEKALKQVKASDAKALLIHSMVDSGFSSGAHLRELHQELSHRNPAQQKEDLSLFLSQVHALFRELDLLPIPVVGMVHGLCFGGGFELALCCDVLLAEQNARFAFPELRLGIIPGFGGIPRLRRNIGCEALISYLLYSGGSVGAQKAQEVGLVSQVLKPGKGLKAAKRLALQMTKYPQKIANHVKPFVKTNLDDLLKQERELFIKMFFEFDTQSALEAFVSREDVLPYLAK